MPERAPVTDHASAAAPAVCPYCSLLCDDVSLAANPDGSFKALANACRRARADYARTPLAAQAEIGGRPVPLARAVARAAQLLKRAQHPLIAGLATDVDGMRAAIALAERCGATLDHVHGEAMSAMVRLLQTRGGYTTTLSEVRNRADCVLLVGLDLDSRHENFVRRCLRPSDALLPERLAARRLVYLGATPPRALAGTGLEVLRCPAEATAAALGALLAILRGARLNARSAGGVQRSALTRLAARLRSSEYTVITCAPGALGVRPEPALAAAFAVVEELNRTTRAALLALGGDDGGQTAQATCAWLTGYPLRIRCSDSVTYDPIAHASAALLASGATDATLWIDAYGRHPTPPGACLPASSVVLGAVRPATMPEVFIAVGTPGLDHAARLVRTDAVVSLPLAAQRASALPAVAIVLAAMAARLA